jgi:hypothetical protein
MAFLNEAKAQVKGGGRRTKLDEIREKLGEKEYKEFLEAMNDKSITCTAISRALANRDIQVAANTILNARTEMERNVNK